MNIEQLESYNLDDAVKFHDTLNPALWDNREHLKPEIREHLLAVASDFADSLGLRDLEIKDITISGSNAGYTYTPHSDIDLHLIVDRPELCDEVYAELFTAKKNMYNEEHSITIKGIPVELYVEMSDEPVRSQGVYSILNQDWVAIPRRRAVDINDMSVRNRYDTLEQAITHTLKTKDLDKITAILKKLKKLRQAGLDAHGEFGPENLAFKMLRSQGYIDQLRELRNELKSRQLSLKERKPKESFKYGYGVDRLEEVELTPDGTNPTTCMFTNEDEQPSDEDILKDFIEFCYKELKLNDLPTIKLRRDPQWSVVNKTFGRYTDAKKMLEVAWGQRHIMDVLRTVAHELTHAHQHERDGEAMGPEAGETGSEWENEANARAGILMRDYARLHPDYFSAGQAQGLHESYTVNNFALNEYKDMAAYRRWNMSPKTSQRGRSRHWVDNYGNLFVDTALVESDNQFHNNLRLSKELSAALRDMDMRDSVVIKVGNDISVISTVAIPSETGGRIELSGFVNPKKITNIILNNNNEIDTIEFDDGSQFPEAAEFTTVGGHNITTTAFFPDQKSASRAFSILWFEISKLEGQGWILERYMSESKLNKADGTLNETSGYIPTAAEANDPRYKMALTVDVQPGEIGRCANAFLLNTDSQGHPQELRPDGVVNRLYEEYRKFKV